jgi:DNA-binding CsgD family transcriptional regulator
MSRLRARIVKLGHLTPKEGLVLCYLCRAYSRKEIATDLGLHISTVNRYIESISEKLDSHSHAEIVSTAQALGLVSVTLHKDSPAWHQVLLMLLVFNSAQSHLSQLFTEGVDGIPELLRGPRSPRPIRTNQTTTRLARSFRKKD